MFARLFVLFLSLSAGCAMAYRLIGSSLDPDGMLREPFALIPLAWLFLGLAMVSGLVHLARVAFRVVAGRPR